MSMFELETAKLGEVEGQGYAFTKRTAFGKAFQGVVFVDDSETAETLKEEDELVFEGTVYHRRRSRGPRKDSDTFPVEITGVTTTGLGERISFTAVDNPNP